MSEQVPGPPPHVSIVIADDHPIVRAGLRQAIESDPSLRVVAEAADGEAALARIRECRPAIAVIDMWRRAEKATSAPTPGLRPTESHRTLARLRLSAPSSTFITTNGEINQ